MVTAGTTKTSRTRRASASRRPMLGCQLQRKTPDRRHKRRSNAPNRHSGDCINYVSLLDPFAGSGSTLIAAEQTGRNCYCMELDPKYASVILRRYVEHTGDTAGPPDGRKRTVGWQGTCGDGAAYTRIGAYVDMTRLTASEGRGA